MSIYRSAYDITDIKLMHVTYRIFAFRVKYLDQQYLEAGSQNGIYVYLLKNSPIIMSFHKLYPAAGPFLPQPASLTYHTFHFQVYPHAP